MENIKERLNKNVLKIEESYNISFEIFKNFIFKNKVFVILFFLVTVFISFTAENSQGMRSILDILIVSDIQSFKKIWISFNLFLLLSLISGLMGILIMKKTADWIEENNFSNLGESCLKYLKLTSLFIILFFLFSIILSFIWIIIIIVYFLISGIENFTPDNIHNVTWINMTVCIVAFITLIFIIINTLYFIQIYYLRDLSIYEALSYNFHLCKKNKMKIIMPVALLIFLKMLVTVPLNILNIVTTFSSYGFLTITLTASINSIFKIFFYILTVIIYLNVEYYDFKKV